MRVAVAMSGGVDSSTAAILLREEGHDVFGITAWLWRCASPGESTATGRAASRACCGSPEALRSARAAADAVGIDHQVVDLSEEFEREVVAPTVRAYADCRTPNPCVLCNARVRFPFLIKAARAHGAAALATGHYARLAPPRGVARDDGTAANRDAQDSQDGGEVEASVRLLRGRDPEHDQSYFLFAVSPEHLAFARFPLGDMTKDEARSRAREAGHPAADRLSSQDLCFTGGRSPSALVRERAPEAARRGRIVDTAGRPLGRHGGLVDYTVGQRKGIGVPWTEPLYVVELRPETNELVVGPADELACSRFEVEGVRWFGGEPEVAFDSLVQIRYRTPPVRCRVMLLGGERAEVVLEAPARAVAPGQCAVFYRAGEDGDAEEGGERGHEVTGGGWIARRASG